MIPNWGNNRFFERKKNCAAILSGAGVPSSKTISFVYLSIFSRYFLKSWNSTSISLAWIERQIYSIQFCLLRMPDPFFPLLSSTEPKAQVSVVSLSVVVVVGCCCRCRKLFTIYLLLQNNLANFNQTWHNASLVEGDSSLFKWRAPPFSKAVSLPLREKYLD